MQYTKQEKKKGQKMNNDNAQKLKMEIPQTETLGACSLGTGTSLPLLQWCAVTVAVSCTWWALAL